VSLSHGTSYSDILFYKDQFEICSLAVHDNSGLQGTVFGEFVGEVGTKSVAAPPEYDVHDA
jgi:hypothetical protein